MATLADEVARIREQGMVEMDREHERLRSQTEQEIARIRQNGSNEIDAATPGSGESGAASDRRAWLSDRAERRLTGPVCDKVSRTVLSAILSA